MAIGGGRLATSKRTDLLRARADEVDADVRERAVEVELPVGELNLGQALLDLLHGRVERCLDGVLNPGQRAEDAEAIKESLRHLHTLGGAQAVDPLHDLRATPELLVLSEVLLELLEDDGQQPGAGEPIGFPPGG